MEKTPLKFTLNIEIDLVPDGESYIYEFKGDHTESFVCPEHAGSHDDIKACVLSNVVMLLEQYALEDDEKLTGDAIALKNRLLELAKVTEEER